MLDIRWQKMLLFFSESWLRVFIGQDWTIRCVILVPD